MTNHTALLRTLQCIVLGGMMAAVSRPALPQQVALATTETAEIQEIVVTGSRIAAPNLVSTSPIDVITAKEILLTGKNDISDILYQLPQNFMDHGNQRNHRLGGGESGQQRQQLDDRSGEGHFHRR